MNKKAVAAVAGVLGVIAVGAYVLVKKPFGESYAYPVWSGVLQSPGYPTANAAGGYRPFYAGGGSTSQPTAGPTVTGFA